MKIVFNVFTGTFDYVGDTTAPTSGGILDGGSASSTYSGGPIIDCGHAS